MPDQYTRKGSLDIYRADADTSPEDNANLEKLIARAMRGSKEALIVLCQVTAKSVLFRVKYILENHEDSEDVAQEVMIRMCTGIRSLKTPWAFSLWLNKIIINETNRYLVKNSRHGVLLNLEEYKEDIQDEDDDFLPQDYLVREDVRSAVINIIQDLSERQKQALLLYYYDGMGVTEIAETLGVSKPTVSVALKRARQNIRKELQSLPGIAFEPEENLAMIPIGSLLSKVLRDEAISGNIVNQAWIQEALANCAAHLNQSTAYASAAPVIAKKVAVVAAAVVASVIILVNIPSEEVQEPYIPVSPQNQVVYENTVGKIDFEGGDDAGSHVNPTRATAWASSDQGALTIYRWEITDLDNNTVFYSGEGDTVEGILSDMLANGENGQYMLRFFAKDEIGGNYTIGNSFIIHAR